MPCDLRAVIMSKRILFVEDEPGLVMTLTDRLRSEGYTVETATDGEAGLTRAASEFLRRDHPRHHAAAQERLRCLPRPASARYSHADHYAHGARSDRR